MPALQKNKLLDHVRLIMRIKQYSIQTERIYCDWISRYVNFHKMYDPSELEISAETKVEDFLKYLVMQRNLAVSSQNQAMNALVFLYNQALEKPLEKTVNFVRPTKNRKTPVVLTDDEVKDIISLLEGVPQLIVKLIYGSGLRITEAIRLRVQDIDLDNKKIIVSSAKGNKDRETSFSSSIIYSLCNQLQCVKLVHERDLLDGYGAVYLPNSLNKSNLNINKEWGCQYVFPARNLSVDTRSNLIRRHHIDQSGINKAIKRCVGQLGIQKQVSANIFRDSFATQLIRRKVDTDQALSGHNCLETNKKVNNYLMNQSAQGLTTPQEDLGIN